LLNVASPQAVPVEASALNSVQTWFGSPAAIRELILKESFRANVGHIGSALSVVEIVAALYSQILRIESPKDIERDRFILAKGHAALALYVALYFRGLITAGQLSTFCGNDTTLGVHPEPGAPGIDFGTGSLGQGLSYGAGAALAARWQKSKRRIFVLISDAECNEGSTWEAILFAAHHRLANLCVIVDLNKQQAFGYTKDVIDIPKMKEVWQSLNWDVHEADGHNTTELVNLMSGFNYVADRPHVILANTVCGKGVSFMERQIKWHYSPLSESELQQALLDVNAGA
jgi:transketolase